MRLAVLKVGGWQSRPSWLPQGGPMVEKVGYELSEGVAVLTVASPPANALDPDLRHALFAALARAANDQDARAVLICSKGRNFLSGEDPAAFSNAAKGESLGDLCAVVEGFEKPVVALVSGRAPGGGFELALAAHYRIAAGDAQMGLGDIALGLPPSAGASQRLPRIVGARAALDLLLSGRVLTARDAHALGLVDAVAGQDAKQTALSFAQDLAGRGAGPRRSCDRVEGLRDLAGYLDDIARVRAQLVASVHPAPGAIVDCVEAAALLPFENGIVFEKSLYDDCARSAQAQALIHIFQAERRVLKSHPAPGSDAVPRVIGIAGGGLGAAGIATACLDAGLSVILAEEDDDALTRARARIALVYRRAVDQRRISPEERAARLDRLDGVAGVSELGRADLVIDTTGDTGAHFAALADVLKPGAVLAVGAVDADLKRLAYDLPNRSNLLALHFLEPVNTTKVVEILPGPDTAPWALEAAFALARRLGRFGVLEGAGRGMIGIRLARALNDAVGEMLFEGATPEAIDRAMRDYGMARGPCETADIIGLDVLGRGRQGDGSVGAMLCERGRSGRGAGRGYYRYEGGASPRSDDPEVLELLAQWRGLAGLEPGGGLEPAEIAERCMAAMANEGAYLLEERVALHAYDIDLVAVHGLGLARWRGGPMREADRIGALELRSYLRALSGDQPGGCRPAPLFDDLIKNGASFAELDRA